MTAQTRAASAAHASTGPSLASAGGMAGQFLASKLRGYDAALGETMPRVLASGDGEAVHDFRVALRRTRTVLEVGRDVFGRFYANEVRRALRDVHRATGALRDEEVLLELLASLNVDRPDVKVWTEGRARRERRLRTALRRRIREGDVDRGRRLLDAMLAFRTKPSRDRRVTKFARRAVEDARREVERRRSGPLHEPEQLHQLRIAYKRLRYTIETFEGLLPQELAALVQPATRFQSKLGKLHDIDMALAVVRAARSLGDPGRDALLAALEGAWLERAASVEDSLGTKVHGPAGKVGVKAAGAKASAAKVAGDKAVFAGS